MPNMSPDMLKKNISSGDFSELYVLYGEEKFALKTRAKKLIDKASPDNFREFNLNEFTSSASVDTIADAALAVPFMAERKCVVVSDYDINALSEVEYKKLDELVSSLSDMTVLIFVYPTAVFENKGNWSKFLKKPRKRNNHGVQAAREKGACAVPREVRFRQGVVNLKQNGRHACRFCRNGYEPTSQ